MVVEDVADGRADRMCNEGTGGSRGEVGGEMKADVCRIEPLAPPDRGNHGWSTVRQKPRSAQGTSVEHVVGVFDAGADAVAAFRRVEDTPAIEDVAGTNELVRRRRVRIGSSARGRL